MHLYSLFRTHALTEQETKKSLRGICLMGFFWSTATLMVVSVFPIYLTEVLGASYTEAGLLEAAALFLTFMFKSFSGVMSDVFRHRKPLIALGSILSVTTKLIFAAANSVHLISIARMTDRAVKGIRSSPTDALIADLSQVNVNRGRSFGLYKTSSLLGVGFGALIAMILMRLTDQNYPFIFYASMIPGLCALFVLFMVVKQPPIQDEIKKTHKGWRIDDIQYLPWKFWVLLGIVSILMLARFSENNIIYRARSIGWSKHWIPLITIGMELMNASLAYPIGRFSDHTNRYKLLFKGMFVLVLANFVFISTESLLGVAVGSLLAGAHMGITQGLLSTLVSESIPAELRGTAFALYYLCIGFSVSGGNIIAGHLNDTIGTVGAFCGGIVFTSLSMLALWGYMAYKKTRVVIP
jgi:MFS family permease